MTSLADKLQLKDQPLRLVNPPAGFAPEGAKLGEGGALLVFVKDAAELREHAVPAFEAARADRLSWIAYPKAGKLGTDLNRDILCKLVEPERIKPVRNVAVDDTWSALRFRPA